MELHLKAPKIWLASEAVDFRKSIQGLSECVMGFYRVNLEANIFVFHNKAKNKLKLLAYHRNGMVMIYKVLDKKKFVFKENEQGLYEITEQQLSWLLAGLDWVSMSSFNEFSYQDYY